MNKTILACFISLQCLLMGCTPVKIPVTNEYRLDTFSNHSLSSRPTHQSILVTLPDAASGYQTEQMLYIKKPHELQAFAQNAWVAPPANMLLPLILQSLQQSHYFYAITSSPNAEQTNYRLDTQLIELHQSFLTRPSTITLVVNVVLTHASDNRIVVSRLINQRVSCPMETPYGGVLAANQATKNLTTTLSELVVRSVKQDKNY